MPTVTSPRGLRRIKSRAFALESALLRASVDALSVDRWRCRHCHRTPLTGERVHLYAARHRTDVVCDLCRPQRVAAPDSTLIVRPPGETTVHRVDERK